MILRKFGLQCKKMTPDYSQDVLSIREWLAKESYLPQDFDDFMLRKFVHSCYGSLEKTKKCIERFCTTRSVMSEIYTSRDPMSANVQTAFSITNVVCYPVDNDYEMLIHQLNDPNLENFNFYDVLKSFCIQGDYWLKVHDVLPAGHIIVVDMKDYAMKIITKVNIMYFRDFLIYLLEAMPVRVKQVHVVNCPSFYEKLYALVKPVLPADVCNIIKFHLSHEALHKVVSKQHLPRDYGGEAITMKEQHLNWLKRIESNKQVFLNDNMWKADLRKKPKNGVETTMVGSFRTLSID